MMICGILAVIAREDDGSSGTPYFIFAFLPATLVCNTKVDILVHVAEQSHL